MVTPILNLLADLTGQTIGNLLDPFLWGAMVAAAFRLRMRWILPLAILVAVLFESVLYMSEPSDLQVHRFAAYTLIGRALAGGLIGYGARYLITRRRRARAARLPAPFKA